MGGLATLWLRGLTLAKLFLFNQFLKICSEPLNGRTTHIHPSFIHTIFSSIKVLVVNLILVTIRCVQSHTGRQLETLW